MRHARQRQLNRLFPGFEPTLRLDRSNVSSPLRVIGRHAVRTHPRQRLRIHSAPIRGHFSGRCSLPIVATRRAQKQQGKRRRCRRKGGQLRKHTAWRRGLDACARQRNRLARNPLEQASFHLRPIKLWRSLCPKLLTQSSQGPVFVFRKLRRSHVVSLNHFRLLSRGPKVVSEA